jgi:NDP-sugar pyrophosphorylase family protein
MRPLTYDLPKPLLKVHEKTLLEHQIAFLKDHVDSIAVTVGYMPEKVSQRALELGADFIFQNNSGGNANWLNSSILRDYQAPIIIITCDNLMDINLTDIEKESAAFKERSFLVTRTEKSELKGDRIAHSDGRITSITQNLENYTLATGLQVINPGTLTPKVNFDNFHQVWNDLISKKSLYTSRSYPSKWVAIDTIIDLENANKVC